MNNPKNVFIAGHDGMVGKAIKNQYLKFGNAKIITIKKNDLDLRSQAEVYNFFKNNKIDEVIIAAAKVGGINANDTLPADFIYDNLLIECNLIHNAHLFGINKILFLGSSCIYPKKAKQPMSEKEMLSGYLEKTNEPYAVAKIAGIKMCESYNRQFGRDYRTVIPTNLYGENDNFNTKTSHVIPGLIARFFDAKKSNSTNVEVWGTGNQLREFLHVEDMASACQFVMDMSKDQYSSLVEERNNFINVGTGKEITIKSLAKLIGKIAGYSGSISFDESLPDGTPQKLLNVSKLSNAGWKYSISLEEGLKRTYGWYAKNISIVKK